MSDNRGSPSTTGPRGHALPDMAMAPNATQPSHTSQSTPQSTSASQQRSQPAPAPPANLDNHFRFSPGPGPNMASRDGPSSGAQQPQPSQMQSLEERAQRFESFLRSRYPEAANVFQQGRVANSASNPLSTGPPGRRRAMMFSRRPQTEDSDEDGGFSSNEEEHMMRYEDEFGPIPSPFRSMFAEDHVRAAQVLRGQLSGTKRVASKQALAQLQSVDLNTLPEGERTCVICYNDFGQKSPEGILEAPLRLPKCRHVFGDHCLKKWFEESDSCPYCRDKVPSEPAMVPSLRAFRDYYRRHRGLSTGNSTPGSEDSMFRMLAEQQREIARYRIRQEATNAARSRERRSPPTEPDTHRRTRPRHTNFMPSYTNPTSFPSASNATRPSPGGGPNPGQHGSTRERMGPIAQNFWHPSRELPPLGHAIPMYAADYPSMFGMPAPYPPAPNPPPPNPAMSFSANQPVRHSPYAPGPNLGPLDPPSFMDVANNNGTGNPNAGGGADRQMQ
ncbi:hypothetical protein VTJ49DRAFT_7314 [Mycothermus thermophilus]|uniref:RING-type domain-containing protein n=1 Tax=Humicola insolens TaxID=85995 RepID=A0ABR3VH54_HUMIN